LTLPAYLKDIHKGAADELTTILGRRIDEFISKWGKRPCIVVLSEIYVKMLIDNMPPKRATSLALVALNEYAGIKVFETVRPDIIELD